MSNVQLQIKNALHGITVTNDDKLLFEAVATGYAKAYLYTGFESPSKQVGDIYVNEVTNCIKSDFPQLRISEIPILFHLGYTHKFGDFTGLAPATPIKWVRQYLETDERKEAVKNYVPEQKTLPKETESGKEDKNEKAIREMAESVWVNFLTTKETKDYNNFCFDYLLKTGQIEVDLSEYRDEAISEIRSEASLMMHDLAGKWQGRNIITQLESGTYEENIQIRAKKLALEEIFNNYLKTKTEPKF